MLTDKFGRPIWGERARLERITELHSKARAEATSLRTENHQLRKNVGRRNEAITRLRASVDSLKRTNKELQERVDALETVKTSAGKIDRAYVDARLQLHASRLDKLEKGADDVRVTGRTGVPKSLQPQVIPVTYQGETRTADPSVGRNVYEDWYKESVEVNKRLGCQVNELEQANRELRRQNESMQAIFQEQSISLGEAHCEMNAAKDEASQLRKDHDKLEQENAELKSHVEYLTKYAKEHRAELVKVRKKLIKGREDERKRCDTRRHWYVSGRVLHPHDVLVLRDSGKGVKLTTVHHQLPGRTFHFVYPDGRKFSVDEEHLASTFHLHF